METLVSEALMNRIVRSFFNGLVIVVPAVATIYVIYLIFVKIDGLLNFAVPGVGFFLTLALITLVGFLASNLVTRKLFDYLEQLFVRVPLVKLIYSSIRDLIGAFVGEQKTFDRPVIVTLGGGAKAIGFVTQADLEFLGLPGHVAVYVPQSYNFAGNLLVLARDQVAPLEGQGSQLMAFVVSGGLSTERNRESPARAGLAGERAE
jgi:uncharacterized membrane protein